MSQFHDIYPYYYLKQEWVHNVSKYSAVMNTKIVCETDNAVSINDSKKNDCLELKADNTVLMNVQKGNYCLGSESSKIASTDNQKEKCLGSGANNNVLIENNRKKDCSGSGSKDCNCTHISDTTEEIKEAMKDPYDFSETDSEPNYFINDDVNKQDGFVSKSRTC